MALGEVVVGRYRYTLHYRKDKICVVNLIMFCFVFVGLPYHTRVISGVAGKPVVVIGLYSQPVFNGSTIDK
jgi:hypothetical protein